MNYLNSLEKAKNTHINKLEFILSFISQWRVVFDEYHTELQKLKKFNDFLEFSEMLKTHYKDLS